MAPGLLVAGPNENGGRPVKRLKSADVFESQGEPGDCSSGILSHPLQVKPAGNAFGSSIESRDNIGVFGLLPDEVLYQVLEQLGPSALLRLGSSCRFLYAFCYSDELWRALFVQSPPTDFAWLGTWRATYLRLEPNRITKIPCPHVYSDVLHRPFFCAHTPLQPYTENIPRHNQIPRISDLSIGEFLADWTHRPFILTSPVKSWPGFGKWKLEYLVEHYGDTCFRAEAVDWPLKTYVRYMKDSKDESPLYLFDRGFDVKMGISVGRNASDASYWPPDCFGEDMFDVLGEQRPDRRWLIIGPERSGSTFHKDPNATSAWNAPLTGSKYWLMFPSGADLPPPPGVILSDDQSEITSPLSIAEYLLNFHAVARATPGCKEGICHAGEILHVPSGWFHLVLNLEESIALTQNFVPAARLPHVLRFLRDTPDQASGFQDEVVDPFGLFVDRLQEKHPELLQEALRKIDAKKGKWEEAKQCKASDDAGDVGFSFSFESEDEEADEAS